MAINRNLKGAVSKCARLAHPRRAHAPATHANVLHPLTNKSCTRTRPPNTQLQELSADARDWRTRDALVRHAMSKFRLAIRGRPDFDRGCYNLGTVFYTFACAMQSEQGQPKGAYAVVRTTSMLGATLVLQTAHRLANIAVASPPITCS